jgi:RNA polymerase sigma-70 factor (ECF subfamily)
MPLSSENTNAKIISLQQGLDEKSFEQIFKTHFKPLCFFARKYIKDTDICKEIVHNVFVNIWEKRNNIDLQKNIKSYLFSAVYSRCMNHIRDQKKFDGNATDHIEVMEKMDERDIEQKMAETELEDRINVAIQSLPEKCREVFQLNRMEGLKYKEIAEKLGISIKTVENQVSKALKVLREKLSDYAKIIIIMLITSH